MPSARRIPAVLAAVEPVREAERCGLRVRYRATRARDAEEEIADWLDLGPTPSFESSLGVGRCLRLLRALRLAAPRPPEALLGAAEELAARLRGALGRALWIGVRPRSRVSLQVWTEDGVEAVDDVADVVMDANALLVRRLGHRLPVRVPRERVLRQQSRREVWLEVVAVERR